MEYDYRSRTGAGSSYDSQVPIYRTPSTSSPSIPSSHPMYGQSLYPRIGQQQGHMPVPPVGRHSSYHQTSAPPPSSGLGIRVALKPEYRITPPPPLAPQVVDIPRSKFHFDFDFERRVLAEAEKETQNWSKLRLENHNLPSKPIESSSSSLGGSAADPVVSKYIASGLNREAVPLAVANYGDNPTKVQDFTNGYTLLREMGFSSNNVAEALLMYDNDTEKALTHFLSGSS